MPGALAAGQLVDDRYALEEALDEDALGTVWRALDRGLGRHVSVRDVAFAGEEWRDDETHRRQALETARLAIRLDHPGAVHVYDAFLDGDRLVVVTELVKGRPLASVVARKGPLPAKRVAAMGLELLEPLVAAHAIGVVHGAVTPSAVLIPERGRFLLTGFGLAPRFLDATSTAWVLRVGTPACVAPEQASHRGSSPASDLWSLGATLYHAVEGTHAFGGETPGDVLDAIVDGTLRPPRRAGRLLPLLAQLLDKDPEGRPAPEAIRQQLTEIAGVHPPSSPTDGPEEVEAEQPPVVAKRRIRRGRRSTAETEAPNGAVGDRQDGEDGEDGEAATTVGERDWDALVTSAAPTASDEPELMWRDWMPADGVDASDEWLPPSPRPEPPADEPPADEERATPAPVATPAADAAESGRAAEATEAETEAEAEPEAEPRRFRSTPSWPPPPRRRWGIAILSFVVVVVTVALLVTDGRIGRNRAQEEAAGRSGQERPVLATDPESVPRDWITYRNTSVDFGLSYPPGWTLREEGQTVTVRDPGTGTQLRMDYSSPPGPDPEETWAELERSFAGQHPDDYRRLQLSPATYLGHRAALWEFTYADGNAAKHAVDLGFVTKKYRFALFFESPADQWQAMLPTFRAFLSSVTAPK
jgi:hypothetical protein